MSEALVDRVVLVTRPRSRIDELCQMIEAEGGKAVRLPVISTRPLLKPDSLFGQTARLSGFSQCIFTSQHAVKYTLDLLQGNIRKLVHLQVIAIGKATVDKLEDAGFSHVLSGDRRSSSEALLDLPCLQADNINGKGVLIVRGEGGRELLAETLQQRGARIEYVNVYQRVPVHYDKSILNHVWSREKPDSVVVTSSEGLQLLFDMLSSDQKGLLLSLSLIVLSERTAKFARNLGFIKQPVVVNSTTNRGILDGLKKVPEH